MSKRSVAPSINEAAFDCPHCGAYTTQTWHELSATSLSGDSRTPRIPNPAIVERIRADEKLPEDGKKHLIDFFEKVLRGLVFIERNERGKYGYSDVHNLNLSECFNCRQISVWVYDRLVFPAATHGPAPNPDLPDEVRQDYEEAGRILTPSPRGSAALLRLAIQKLCAALGEKGKNIDDDIGSLVKRGLSPLVQKALDSVRVIGNEAVHPGTLDLRDDVDTATRLFDLVNIVAEQMISNPKHVEELYAKLPDEKKKAIDKRDGKPS